MPVKITITYLDEEPEELPEATEEHEEPEPDGE